jgi:hypothetical protein
MEMRRLTFSSLVVLLASCAPRPQATPAPQTPVVQEQPAERNRLIGLTPQDLVGRFGSPALQIHEGTSLKLQFRGRSCVLDAYLYPQAGNGTLRVTHVDTRTPTGVDSDQAACISALETPS